MLVLFSEIKNEVTIFSKIRLKCVDFKKNIKLASPSSRQVSEYKPVPVMRLSQAECSDAHRIFIGICPDLSFLIVVSEGESLF